MCKVFDNFFANAWDWAKRIFGRSRTIFLNVMGFFAILYTEVLQDYLVSFDWDAFFRHEVSMLIGLGVQVLNFILRLSTTEPVNFGRLPNIPAPSVEAPSEPVTSGNSETEQASAQPPATPVA